MDRQWHFWLHVIDGAYCTFKSKAHNRNSVLNCLQIESLENLGFFSFLQITFLKKKCLYFRYANASGSSESLVRNIWVFSPLVPSKREKYILVLLSLYIFWGKCVYFSIFEWYNSQLCFFWQLKSNHISLKKIQTEQN